jgi:hypothetical protein
MLVTTEEPSKSLVNTNDAAVQAHTHGPALSCLQYLPNMRVQFTILVLIGKALFQCVKR